MSSFHVHISIPMRDYDCVGLCASSILLIPIKFNVPHHVHPTYARTCTLMHVHVHVYVISPHSFIALYQKATSLGSAVFKNKSSFISDVDVVWFGGQSDSFPFVV